MRKSKGNSAIADFSAIVVREFRSIASSPAILLVLIGGVFLYGFLYNYMYAPNTVRDAPIAVVDRSHSRLSREYIRGVDASPKVAVTASSADFPAAKERMKRGDVVGILYLPEDFEDRLGRGDESVFTMFGTTQAFLYYAAIQEASAGAMLELENRWRPEMAVFLPTADLPQITAVRAMNVEGVALYNPTEGYGDYLIPAVLMVILFQTLWMVVGMLAGEERTQGTLAQRAREGVSWRRAMRMVVGKTVVYGGIYAVLSLFLLGLIPLLFHLPYVGHRYEVAMLMVPYLLATALFALSTTCFFSDGETPPILIAFFSVGFLFLSGVSYPLELMPRGWQWVHYLVPVAPATLAFVKIHSMGASLLEVRVEYLTLWIQCGVYGALALWVCRYRLRHAQMGKSARQGGVEQ